MGFTGKCPAAGPRCRSTAISGTDAERAEAETRLRLETDCRIQR